MSAAAQIPAPPSVCKILSLDGGGAKGFYTLGVLNEIEAMLGGPLCEHFDLVFGTSTGAIIAALLCLGYSVSDVHDLYKKHVPTVMGHHTSHGRSKALAELTNAVFGKSDFTCVKTGIGIVSTRWQLERPMIFKGDVSQAHGRTATFVPGFGCTIADAVKASCSAYPYFEKCTLTTSTGNQVELIDGGYCANNPTLYAIADAVRALNRTSSELRVVSVGVGVYPEPAHWTTPKYLVSWLAKRLIGFTGIQLLQKTLNVNTASMEQLRFILFKNIRAVRINDTFEQPEMATNLLESDLKKLNLLYQRGGESFAKYETQLRELLDLPAQGTGHA
ncbi:MAG TPA: patatin-like phospholipase family protein [Candidatus Sulfotelmatobacter sp.]|nr:patatin-like phospholipase family protein [Candidatus Sulfotelmatobacter sp.]